MATLTRAMLNDLHKGNAAISLLAFDSVKDTTQSSDTFGGIKFSSLDFTAADQLFTLKDSFTLSQDEPTVNETKIDQGDAVVDSDSESGSWTMTGNVPSLATALLEYFYTKGAGAPSAIKGQDGTTTYSGEAFFATPKEVMATVMVESASKKTAIVFAKVKFVASLSSDGNDSPMYVKFNGTIQTNTDAKGLEGDFAVLKANA